MEILSFLCTVKIEKIMKNVNGHVLVGKKEKKLFYLQIGIGYIDCPRYKCKLHGTCHAAASHLAVLHPDTNVSVDLIKVNDFFISETLLKLLLNLYKDESGFNISALRRKYYTIISNKFISNIKKY